MTSQSEKITNAKMKNKVLSIFHDVIPYVKELRALTGSMDGCILMQQLDYWFAKYPNGFYKFLNPVGTNGYDELGNPISGHPHYREGDSWCEELGCSDHEFRRMFDAVGIRWKSKSEYMNAADPFCGKCYCSFVDRKQNLTYYFRNHRLVDEFLDKFVCKGAHNWGTSEKRATDHGEAHSQTPQKPASLKQRAPSKIKPTTSNGAVVGNNLKTTWNKNELHAELDDFVESAFWFQKSNGGVRSSAGFKSTIRKRIASSGPTPEDWDAIVRWRASQKQIFVTKSMEVEKPNAEKKKRLEDALSCFDVLSREKQKVIEERFLVHLESTDKYAHDLYLHNGLASVMVMGKFRVWLADQD